MLGPPGEAGPIEGLALFTYLILWLFGFLKIFKWNCLPASSSAEERRQARKQMFFGTGVLLLATLLFFMLLWIRGFIPAS